MFTVPYRLSSYTTHGEPRDSGIGGVGNKKLTSKCDYRYSTSDWMESQVFPADTTRFNV